LNERSTFIELIEINKKINLPNITVDELIVNKKRLQEIIVDSTHHHVPVSEESEYFGMFRNIETIDKRINQKLSEFKNKD
jgi:hypothetical protein